MPPFTLAALTAPHLPPSVAVAELRRLHRPDLERLALELARPYAGCAAPKANHSRTG